MPDKMLDKKIKDKIAAAAMCKNLVAAVCFYSNINRDRCLIRNRTQFYKNRQNKMI